MKKLILCLIAGFVGLLSVSADNDNYFDDKVYTSPVPHKAHYDLSGWQLEKVERFPSATKVTIHYTEPYRNIGWSNMRIDDYLKDDATGTIYPLIYSTGLPKEPHRHNFTEAGPVDMRVVLFYHPIPESVKSVSFRDGSLYNIDISNVPLQASDGFQFHYLTDVANKSGTLKVTGISSNPQYYILFFQYTPREFSTAYLPAIPKLVDRTTGKTIDAKHCQGISLGKDKASNVQEGVTLCFYLQFPKPMGVDKVDLVFLDNSPWNISNIPVK